MKLHAIKQSLRKHQTQKKIPKIALLIALTIILSVISIYSTKDVPKPSPKFDFAEDSMKPSAQPMESNDKPCHGDDNSSQLCHGRDSEVEALEVTKRDEEEPSSRKEVESQATKSFDVEGEEITLKPKDEESEIGESTDVEAPEITLKPKDEESETRKSSDVEAQELPLEAKAEKSEATGWSGIEKQRQEQCDLFSGEWIPNPGAPYYTNSCYGIQEHQNCMKYGRPDSEFMKWRWQPDSCELPIFDPNQFLELVRGKSIAFVGDSVSRNHLQSLMCLLSRVLYPQEISNSTDENRQWEYKEYNFKISIFWAPFLVRSGEITAPNDKARSFSLYLDEFDEKWTTKIKDYDYVIISAGHWFFRPAMFHENGSLVGCQYCPQDNVTRLPAEFSYQRAFRTAFRAINSVNYKGVTFLRTFAPSHFENGTWDNGGTCVRTRPFQRNETVLTGYNLDFYNIQLDELRIAQEEGSKRGLKFRLFDATKTMLLRPDGHPSKYGHWPTQNVELPNDCVHWCLPGPIDTWNDFLLELLKRAESEKSVG